MKSFSKGLLLVSCFLFQFSAAQAEIYPIGDDLTPIEDVRPIDRDEPIMRCERNRNETQLIVVREHLRAIKEAVGCSDTEKAVQISLGLAEYLEGETAHQPAGLCYDDRRCTQAISRSHVSKASCKAAGGKSWIQMTPTQGNCELVR